MNDPERDLSIDRLLDLPRQRVWAAWTTPEHLQAWFAPPGGTVAESRLDLRPGGELRVVVRSGDGATSVFGGCYLEVQPQRRLSWTDALTLGFRPAEHPSITTVLTLQARAFQTAFQVQALHATPEDRRRHEAEGFMEEWAARVDRLVAYMRTL